MYFVVFGAEADLLEIDGDLHRVDEVPDGIDAHELGPEWVASFFEPPMGEQLRLADPETAEACEATESCIVVTGTVDDPVDARLPAQLDRHHHRRPRHRRHRRAQPADAHPLRPRHVARPRSSTPTARLAPPARDDPVLRRGRDTGPGCWVHTRGLRVFGRPDLSMHGVEPDALEATGTLFNALIAELARVASSSTTG